MPEEISLGVITVYKKEDEFLFLLLADRHSNDYWSFPKGHKEEGETDIQAALRELEEETQIKEVEILDLPMLEEKYEVNRKEGKRLKVNKYFIGFVKSQDVVIQESEIFDYKWATYEEALKTFSYQSRKEVLKEAEECIKRIQL